MHRRINDALGRLCPSRRKWPLMTTMIGKYSVKTSYRAAASVIAIAIASLTLPSLAQAKRMGSSKSVRPASIGAKAPAQPAPVAPAAAAKPAAATTAPAATAAPAAVAATPAAAATPARGSGMMGTMAGAAVGAVAGTMAGNALAGSMGGNKEAEAKKAKEEEAKKAEAEAAELQNKLNDAKAKAEAARAAVK